MVLDLTALGQLGRVLGTLMMPGVALIGGVGPARRRGINDLAAAEGVRIAHQNLLLRLQPDGVMLLRIVAVAAGALRPAEAIVGEALAVELEAARLAAVAGLVALRGELLLLEGELAGRLGMARSVCAVEKP